ncbi:MAG: hypothetical protein RR211_01300, partial [Pseudoflavonifractor sp.]
MSEQIKNEFLTLEVASIGAELQALHCPGGPDRGFLWDGNPDIWPRHAPVCFPWNGRLKDGGFTEQGCAIQADMHGFIRDLDHKLVARGEDFLTYRLDWTADEQLWPWSFSFETNHRLEGSNVVTTVTAQNRSDSPMPMQQGFHTALRCPITPGKSPEDYFLRFQQEEQADMVLYEGGFSTGKTQPIYSGASIVPLEPHMFDSDSICLENLRSQWIRLEERDTGRYLQMDIEGFHDVILWSKPAIPGFLCIEPWNGLPALRENIRDRPYARLLAPGETYVAVQRLGV